MFISCDLFLGLYIYLYFLLNYSFVLDIKLLLHIFEKLFMCMEKIKIEIKMFIAVHMFV